jgi:hypothetical protein
MTHRDIRRAASAAFAALVLLAAPAAAQGKRKGQVKPEPNPSTETPPGLAKKGGLPPGQAKKYRPDDGVVVLRDVFGRNGYTVVRTATNGDARYVWYRTSDGVLHRAIVSPGTERLSFTNVPALVLRQVLARLY